jgi:hypothetical protein
MHPVFVKRCERDDLEIESMWLDETDLEADDGANLPIEQPTQIITRKLDDKDQDDRIRAIFGLTGDDPVPEADEVTLRLYHAHLVTHLDFPFEGQWNEETGPLQVRTRHVKVLGLLPPDEIDDEDGILCRVRMGGKEGTMPLAVLKRETNTPQGRLLEDFRYWIHNWGEAPDVLSFPGQGPFPDMFGGQMPPGMQGLPMGMALPAFVVRRLLLAVALVGAIYGASLGGILFLEGAYMGMSVGSAILAGLLGLAGRQLGMTLGRMHMMRRAPIALTMLGILFGAALGALAGAMAVAFVGTVTGSIAGTILGDLVSSKQRKTRGKFLGGVLGACVGGIVFAVSQDREQALAGLAVGAAAGTLGAVLLFLVAWLTLRLLLGRR